MLFRVSREQAYQDSEALALWIYAVNETAQAFSRLSDAFRTATQRTRNSQVLKRDVHGVLAIQAGRLLSESWDRGAFPEHFYWTYGRRSCLWELFRLRHPDANDLTHVWLWFAFIRWNLIPRYESRFRADWKEEFHPVLDQLLGGCQIEPSESLFASAVSENPNERALWGLDASADNQATACEILAENLALEWKIAKAAMSGVAGDVPAVEPGAPLSDNVEGVTPRGAKAGQANTGHGSEQLSPEARAILFVQERLKTTGKLPTKTAIAEALEVDRRTLNNWSAFKVAYKKLQSENRRQPAKGTKAKDGSLEAWRESAK